ncbi:amino acid dehydrogenase [Rhodococcus rhodnii]|uniref:Glutamate dehydrogenase (NAD(P)+) n=2 Tax=Rhodococcus rhodnii TaxID=38312 RepID=R7WNG3_9NOCA|nr:Glu/Leu/Phe/Val dehydrogenase dimerization domain-containing protein [Rhodococcus rhodnii]EOM76851.1 glutamate dehydrogenase (NAD(P)+) [Rhodococcus rhodnii LMG 5362]TXG89782.1 amino acid dehydrogenase [Rhodococcus rhodnii]
MRHLLQKFEESAPEIVFEWHDSETEARGWTVVNSLRGGAAGGGTRMRAGLDRREVESLAKTMEIKFTVSGPPIGGAKSGIDFDPRDPRRDGVLRRWFAAVAPLLRTYYGTGGDLNIDERADVVPALEALGIGHPQHGVVNGHFGADGHGDRIDRLRSGIARPVTHPDLAPNPASPHTVSDLVTGWGVAESVRHAYDVYGAGDLTGKRVVIQGWGNVGASAAYYLARAGAEIVAILDRDRTLLAPKGLPFERVRELLLTKDGNALRADDAIASGPTATAAALSIGADVFLPCAASRLVTREHLDLLVDGGLEVIACGANVPFADDEIFYGPTYEYADKCVTVVPDFIANCGMARAFAALMGGDAAASDHAVFADVSRTIREALERTHAVAPLATGVAETAFGIALAPLAGDR